MGIEQAIVDANHTINWRELKIRVDFGELVMAEQAEVFDQMEALGKPPDPDKPNDPSRGVLFNTCVAWMLLRRDYPALTFDEVWHKLPGRNVEVVSAPLPEAAGG